MLTLLDRMLMREILKTLAVMLIVLLLLLFANTLVRTLGKVAAGSLSLDLMWNLIGVNMLQMLTTIVPPAFFFAILWVLGRMEADHEITAFANAGAGDMRLYRALFITAIPVALIVAYLILFFFPEAKSASLRLRDLHAQRIGIETLRPGVFNEFDRGRILLFFEGYDEGTGALKNLFVQHRQEQKEGLVTAARANLDVNPETGERFVVLQDGHRYEGLPGRDEFKLGNFRTYGIRLPELGPKRTKLPTAAMATEDLWRSPELEERAELQYRISFPLSVLAFTLLSLPLIRGTPRSSRHGRLIFALLLYAVYMNMQRVAEEWMQQGLTPEVIGIWWLPLMLAAIAGLLLILRRWGQPLPLLRRGAS